MEPTGCPETSVRDCHRTLRSISEELRCHLLSDGSVESRAYPKYTLNTLEYGNIRCVQDFIRVQRHELRDSSKEKPEKILFMMGLQTCSYEVLAYSNKG